MLPEGVTKYGNDDAPGPACSPAERVRRHHTEP
ncbi:hypothetical protein EL75_4960 [Escherichia coli]|nr:hypothetical protein EL75_4960 [Escherichia coli]